jgi:4-amino-4-deoxy-L-arabinose transferase-like glycosyltransferase
LGDGRFQARYDTLTLASLARYTDKIERKRSVLLFAAPLLVAAAVVRLYRLDHFSYGLDEILQGYWIHGSWDFFWKSLRFDAVHPPLDYLVARGLEAFDPADWVRKLPAVFWGTATVLALGILVGRRAGRTAGVLTSVLLAFAPFHVRYSQEFRPYALGLFLLCVALLLLDRFLERPGIVRLLALYLACLATAYALYLAAIVLGVAAVAILTEDSFAEDPVRRRAARRFLIASPLFATALFLAYLPWWWVVIEAARRPPPVPAEAISWSRLGRTLAFFAFAHDDGDKFVWGTALWALLFVAGTAVALRQRGLRFLLVWCFGGFLLIEALEHIHPHWYVSRWFLPAGVVLPVFVALALTRLGQVRRGLFATAIVLVAVLALDAKGLSMYFREGRADWRPLGRFLRSRPKQERIFTENQYSELCVAFYVDGPYWLYAGGHLGRDIWNLDGEVVRLTWSWKPGTTAWLVLGGNPPSPALRSWAGNFAATAFPTAEGAILLHLDPALREKSFGLKR